MKIRFPSWRLQLLFLVVLLPACSSVQQKELDESGRIRIYEMNSEQLANLDNWSLAGRLAVSSSEDGGSGNFRWSNETGGSQMDFHGALGRGAWRLLADAEGAELELADGTIYREDSIDLLLRLQVGWDIPVDSLSWWVRGMAAPGGYQRRVIDQEGNLSELLQDDWTIDFGRYREFGNVRLPVRLTARRSDWKVKLAIRDWKLPEGIEGDD